MTNNSISKLRGKSNKWLHRILSYFRLLVSIVMYCNTELNVIDMFYILWVTTPFWIRWTKI